MKKRAEEDYKEVRNRIFGRISALFSMIGDGEETSILDISEFMGIPCSEVRRSLQIINQAGFAFEKWDMDEEYGDCCDISDLEDDEPFSMVYSDMLDDEAFLFMPDERERTVLRQRQAFMGSDPLYQVKGLPYYQYKDLPGGSRGESVRLHSGDSTSSHFWTLMRAIRLNQVITIEQYKSSGQSRSGSVSPISFIPRGFLYDANSNYYYFLNFVGKDGAIYSFRLDRIIKMAPAKDEHGKFIYGDPLPKDAPRLDRVKCCFGNQIPPDEEITPVRIAIRKSSFSMPNFRWKLEADLRYRTTKRFDEESSEEYVYYEDSILGMRAFRRWVMSYGSAMVVLSPRSLAEEICSIYRKRYELLND